MRIFPGLRASMGRWNYFIVKMSLRDVAAHIKFATEGFEGSTLDRALQRELNESRAKEEIVSYLTGQPDRFFNSIVIAAIGGEPQWFPVSMADDPRFELMADDPVLSNSFGLLRFNGQEKYYALDGQHRLKAIRELVRPDSDVYHQRPDGFDDEELSVVLVVPGDAEDDGEFRRRFRRLFGHLNRYAKPMDLATSIIMDEDDAIAIGTRRLISEHPYFFREGDERDSTMIDMRKGTSMNTSAPHFTKLEVLYRMNTELLHSSVRSEEGWYKGRKLADFKRFRPDDDYIDALYEELSDIWSGLIDVLPDLGREPIKMRNHAVVGSDGSSDERDSLLFWPIGQEMLAGVVRRMLDVASPGTSVVDALAELGRIPWDLDQDPWINFVLVPSAENPDKWVMRNEDRKQVMELARVMVQLVAEGDRDSSALVEVRNRWESYLRPEGVLGSADDRWANFLNQATQA